MKKIVFITLLSFLIASPFSYGASIFSGGGGGSGGSGDMTKAVYDTGDDGTVDDSEDVTCTGCVSDAELASTFVKTESDPIVGAVTGIIKANGGGAISAAVAGTDYVTPTGSGAGLTSLNANELSSGTVPAARVGTDHIDALTEIASALKSGADATLITGTSTNGQCAQFNVDGDIVGAGAACNTASALPVADTTSVVEGSVDDTKELRFEVDGFTTGNVRVATPPDEDFDMVGEATSQTLTNKTIDGDDNTIQDVAVASTKAVAGSGLSLSTDTFATASSEENFLLSGALTCGASTAGKVQVHTTPLQYCDNAGTPALQYAAYGASDGDAVAGDSASSFFDAGTVEHEYGGLELDVSAFDGLLSVTGGSTASVDTKAELEARLSDVSDIAEADGDVFTGTHDFGGADDLEAPNGAAPVVDTAGQFGIDTTDDQLILYGGAKRVIAYTRTKCAVIEDLAAADDDFEIGSFNDPITITAVGVHCKGTCTTGAQISLEDRAGNAMTHTTPTASTGTGNTTYQSVTAANALVAGEGLRFDVDNAVSPETDTYTICYTYTVDAQ